MIQKRLETILREEMGLNVSSIGRTTLQNALARRMRAVNIDDPHAYLKLLKQSRSETNLLVEEVAVNETWFLRDHTPFTVLGQYARSVLAKEPDTCLRLLSIPCATGEEPYSMAITLFEAGLSEKHFRIDAVDISNRSLQYAKRAVYGKRSFRNINKPLINIYFRKTKNGYLLDKRIKNAVSFHRGNLVNISPALPSAGYDVIFCRNLLIYIDKTYRDKAISTLDNLLRKNGLLFVGHAESGMFQQSPFVPTAHHKAFCFYKRKAEKERTKLHSIQVPDFFMPESEPQPFVYDIFAEARTLFAESRFDEVIAMCDDILKHNKPSAEGYYLIGAALRETDDLELAITMLKKAVYLDPEHIPSLKQLTELFLLLGDKLNFENFQRRTDRVLARLRNKKSRKR